MLIVTLTTIAAVALAWPWASYDAFTIKAIMGHRDMKTTERYIRANRLTQEVVFQRVHKLATKQERPPLTVAVVDFNGRGERIRTSDLTVPNRALYQAEPRPDEDG